MLATRQRQDFHRGFVMRVIQRVFRIETVRVVALAWLAFLAVGVAGPKASLADFLPPGYRVPTIVAPRVDPANTLSFDGLDIIERGRTRHTLQFDRSPQRWADHVLRLAVVLKGHGYEAQALLVLSMLGFLGGRSGHLTPKEQAELVLTVPSELQAVYQASCSRARADPAWVPEFPDPWRYMIGSYRVLKIETALPPEPPPRQGMLDWVAWLLRSPMFDGGRTKGSRRIFRVRNPIPPQRNEGE